MDAAGGRDPAVACRPGRSRAPGVRVRQAAGPRDRHHGTGGTTAARAAPGGRGSHTGPLRRRDPAWLAAAGGRYRRVAGGSGAAQAAAAPGPGPGRGRPRRAGAAAGRFVRRGDLGRVLGGAHSGPPDLGGIRGGRRARAARLGGLRGQRGRRRAAGACPCAGRDGPGGLRRRVPDRRSGRAARPQVRQSGAGGRPGPAPCGRAYPAGGVGPDARAGAARRGSRPVRGRREAGQRRGRPPLPRLPGGRLHCLRRRAAGRRAPRPSLLARTRTDTCTGLPSKPKSSRSRRSTKRR